MLFVGHDASRSGAPLSLLHAQRWLAAHGTFSFETLLCDGGPLLDEYRSVAPVTLLPRWQGGLRHAAARADRRWRLELLRQRHALVYANTMASGHIVRALARRRPVITHLRELQPAIDHYGATTMSAVLSHSTLLVACAASVKQNLCEHYGLSPAAVRVVRSSIEPLAASPLTPPPDIVKQRLGIPATAPIIGGCGSLVPNKGPDLFVHLAHALQRLAPQHDAHFIWVGHGDAQALEPLQRLAQRLGVTPRVHFVGEQPRVHDYFQLFDLFAMVSRSDAHPRVCLEAATLGTPSVCFAEAGGIPEFIEDDAGVVVPGWDVEAMAGALGALLDAPERRRQLGARAASKVSARHHASVIGPQIIASIELALAEAPPAASPSRIGAAARLLLPGLRLAR